MTRVVHKEYINNPDEYYFYWILLNWIKMINHNRFFYLKLWMQQLSEFCYFVILITDDNKDTKEMKKWIILRSKTCFHEKSTHFTDLNTSSNITFLKIYI